MYTDGLHGVLSLRFFHFCIYMYTDGLHGVLSLSKFVYQLMFSFIVLFLGQFSAGSIRFSAPSIVLVPTEFK
jgi:hypothetical protein